MLLLEDGFGIAIIQSGYGQPAGPPPSGSVLTSCLDHPNSDCEERWMFNREYPLYSGRYYCLK
jgi:hypothetical protein